VVWKEIIRVFGTEADFEERGLPGLGLRRAEWWKFYKKMIGFHNCTVQSGRLRIIITVVIIRANITASSCKTMCSFILGG
jgi:hypothetical protein